MRNKVQKSFIIAILLLIAIKLFQIVMFYYLTNRFVFRVGSVVLFILIGIGTSKGMYGSWNFFKRDYPAGEDGILLFITTVVEFVLLLIILAIVGSSVRLDCENQVVTRYNEGREHYFQKDLVDETYYGVTCSNRDDTFVIDNKSELNEGRYKVGDLLLEHESEEVKIDIKEGKGSL